MSLNWEDGLEFTNDHRVVWTVRTANHRDREMRVLLGFAVFLGPPQEPGWIWGMPGR